MAHTFEELNHDLTALGIQPGDTVMMHSSFKSLGTLEGGAKTLFSALFTALGEAGTLLLPAFSYDSVAADQPIFDRASTPSCVGYLPEYFRTQVPGVVRSLHATHSVCAKGKRAAELIAGHELDLTPVGVHSPLAKLPKLGGKILILGCHPDHNTSLHGVEETAEPPYLFDRPNTVHYELHDGTRIISQEATRHCFAKNGVYYAQRYGRILNLLTPEEAHRGFVLEADCYLMDAKAVWEKGHRALVNDPLYFVEPRAIEKEG